MGGMTIVEMEGQTIIVVVVVGDTILRRMEATEGEAVASMALAVEGAAEDDRRTSLVVRTTTTIGIEVEGRSANPMIAEEGTIRVLKYPTDQQMQGIDGSSLVVPPTLYYRQKLKWTKTQIYTTIKYLPGGNVCIQ